jgi:PP-loop superfamily ATP-utilizing enzyme
MKMIHITKTPDGGYFIVDATGAPGSGATFAPTSSALTEEGVKRALKKFGLTEKAIESAIRQLNETGNSTVQL